MLRFGRKDKAILVLQHDVMMTRGRLEVNLHEFLKSVLKCSFTLQTPFFRQE